MNTTKLLSAGEAAERLGVSTSFLAKSRVYGGGPAFVKLGSRVAYDPSDLADWIEERKQRSTSETVAAAPK